MSMENFGATTNNIKNEEVFEKETFTSLESLETSLTDLEDKLSLIEKLPLYEKEVADLKKSINTLKIRILEQKN